MKPSYILLALVVIGSLIFIGDRAFFRSSNSDHKSSLSAKNGSSTKSTAAHASVSTTYLYSLPNPPLNCNTSVSIMPLTADYSITGMVCANTSGASMLCNGTLTQMSTNVTVDCTAPNSAVNEVVCSGSANGSGLPSNLNLSYQCYSSKALSNSSVYSCTGSIPGFSSLAINLPLSVSCGA
jgi:hypothetical protein